MDFSSIQLETSNIRNFVGDFIENSIGALDKRTGNIFKELSNLKDDYTRLIKNCIYLLIIHS